MFIGTIAGVIAAFSWPILTVLFGEMVDVFVAYENSEVHHNFKNSSSDSSATDMTTDQFMHKVYVLSGILFGGWVLITISNFFMMTFFPLSAFNQIHTIKVNYFRSVLKQEIAWFDTKSSGDFASRLSA